MSTAVAGFEQRFAERLLALAEDCTGRGVPPDVVVRCLLGAGLAFAQRFDTGASIATQLAPVLDAMAADDGPGDGAQVLQ